MDDRLVVDETGLTVLRPLHDLSVFTCDQGYCDRIAFCEMYDTDPGSRGGWISACLHHALRRVEQRVPTVESNEGGPS